MTMKKIEGIMKNNLEMWQSIELFAIRHMAVATATNLQFLHEDNL